MTPRLTEAQSDVLFKRVVRSLKRDSLAIPFANEGETSYTSRCVQALVSTELDAIQFPGLFRRGDGAASVDTVEFMGMHFYPDVAVTLYSQRLVAVEVKLLRRGNRQNAIATALGQAMIYKSAGYEHAVVLLIDTVGDLHGRSLHGTAGIPPVVVRSLGMEGMAPSVDLGQARGHTQNGKAVDPDSRERV
jgi:hypothetical protein